MKSLFITAMLISFQTWASCQPCNDGSLCCTQACVERCLQPQSSPGTFSSQDLENVINLTERTEYELCLSKTGRVAVKIYHLEKKLDHIEVFVDEKLIVSDHGDTRYRKPTFFSTHCHVAGEIFIGEFLEYGGCYAWGSHPKRSISSHDGTLNLDLNQFHCRTEDR